MRRRGRGGGARDMRKGPARPTHDARCRRLWRRAWPRERAGTRAATHVWYEVLLLPSKPRVSPSAGSADALPLSTAPAPESPSAPSARTSSGEGVCAVRGLGWRPAPARAPSVGTLAAPSAAAPLPPLPPLPDVSAALGTQSPGAAARLAPKRERCGWESCHGRPLSSSCSLPMMSETIEGSIAHSALPGGQLKSTGHAFSPGCSRRTASAHAAVLARAPPAPSI